MLRTIFSIGLFAVLGLIALKFIFGIFGLAVGLLVSIFQTVTSIQDNVLAFIPRAAAIFVVFALTFPWMLRVVTGFAGALIRRLPELVR